MEKEAMRIRLVELAEAIEKNTPEVERRMVAAGIEPDAAVVFTVSKYLAALDKLAVE